MEQWKECKNCKRLKTFEMFNKDKGKKDGHRAVCRLCCEKKYKKDKVSGDFKHSNKVIESRNRYFMSKLKYMN